MKYFILILSLIFSITYCKSQTNEKGVIFKGAKWNSKDFKEHSDSVIVFVTEKNIYLTIGNKKRTYKINNVKMHSPALFDYSCTDLNGEKFEIGYMVMSFTQFGFSFEKSEDDPNSISIPFEKWEYKE